MFKNLASEMMGTSDIGTIIEAKDFNKTDIDDYIFHEDNERIFFVIKRALLHKGLKGWVPLSYSNLRDNLGMRAT